MRNPFGALFERRSIGSPYDLLSAFGRGAQSTAGQDVNEGSAFAVPAVLSCVNIRQRSLGSLPVRVYERLDERSSRPVPWHRASFVLRKPNGWQTWSEFAGTMEAHRVLRGNAYAYKGMAKFPGTDGKQYDDVAQLVPLHPDRMQVRAIVSIASFCATSLRCICDHSAPDALPRARANAFTTRCLKSGFPSV